MSKVLSALGGALPDERPVLSLQIVESVAKCPTGYWPVSRTYDEDADAGLLRQNGLFGKKPSHYICLSKSEGVPGYVMDGVLIVGEREPAPAGFSVAGRAGKRRVCTRVSRSVTIATPPVTDVIVCSKMRSAPKGFILAGEINGKVVCYKLSGGSTDASPTHYENVVTALTPDANRSSLKRLYEGFKDAWSGCSSTRPRPTPEKPKQSPLVSEMNGLSVSPAAPIPRIEEFVTDHDYEALNPSYNISHGNSRAPVRAAPRPPKPNSPLTHASPVQGALSPPVPRKSPAVLPRGGGPQYPTLGMYGSMDGVPFLLHPTLRGLPSDLFTQLPVIKKRSQFELDRDYNYSFTVERQT